MTNNNKNKLFEMMHKLNEDFNPEVNEVMFGDKTEYMKKKEELKSMIDALFIKKNYEIIDNLYRLLVNKKEPYPTATLSENNK